MNKKEDTANKPVMDEAKLQTVMEIIEKAAFEQIADRINVDRKK